MSDNKQSDVATTALPPAPPLTVSGTSSGEEGRGASDIEATSSGGRGSNSPKKMAKWRRMSVKAAAERAKAESGESAATPVGESMLIVMLNEKMKELKVPTTVLDFIISAPFCLSHCYWLASGCASMYSDDVFMRSHPYPTRFKLPL
jgi:hypothetical protein